MIVRFSGIFCALVLTLGLVVEARSAQTLRFDTNVGTFDMVLNPTGNPFLQDHVDNILAYVEAGSYETTVINRAATNFVLQLGGFQAHSLTLPEAFSSFPSVNSFDPVELTADSNNNITSFDTTGLTNTRGTVSLALSSNSRTINGATVGVPNVSSGTSSFFINLGDNSGLLDPGAMNFNNQAGTDVPTGGFVPFAQITDMQTVDLIMALPQANLDSTGQNLAAINIPIMENNRLVIIERVFVLDPMEALAAASSGSSSGSGGNSTGDSLGNDSNSSGDLSVPEPASLMTALGALMFLAAGRRRLLA